MGSRLSLHHRGGGVPNISPTSLATVSTASSCSRMEAPCQCLKIAAPFAAVPIFSAPYSLLSMFPVPRCRCFPCMTCHIAVPRFERSAVRASAADRAAIAACACAPRQLPSRCLARGCSEAGALAVGGGSVFERRAFRSGSFGDWECATLYPQCRARVAATLNRRGGQSDSVMAIGHNDYEDVTACAPPKPFPSKRIRSVGARADLWVVPARVEASTVPRAASKPRTTSAATAVNVAQARPRGRPVEVRLQGEMDETAAQELKAVYPPSGVDMGDMTWGGMVRRPLRLVK
ncbi:hypothetical protein CDCA_CDCA04G1439 [Cyanidium caldarium]|uniref:Uncharacterized protein n=1 Tax=Cyanidium caldarium TaxID=2771 RepID=A0AAV9ITD1_CYACA|nr:hypothetical protein CDCA_CDCA04G1439 [Cyanidium caldarium]